MNYRKLKVQEVGTDTYIDYEANVSIYNEAYLEVESLLDIVFFSF